MRLPERTFHVMERDTYRRIVARLVADGTEYPVRRSGIGWDWADAICVDRRDGAPIKDWLKSAPVRCFVNDLGSAGYDFYEFPDAAEMTLFALAWR